MKGANPLKWICPYKNDITNNLEPQKPVIYSRYQNPNNKKAGPFLTLPQCLIIVSTKNL